MNKQNTGILKIIGAIAPLVISCILLSVQWGVVTTKLNIFGDRMEKMEQANEKVTDTMIKISNDVARMKGKINQ